MSTPDENKVHVTATVDFGALKPVLEAVRDAVRDLFQPLPTPEYPGDPREWQKPSRDSQVPLIGIGGLKGHGKDAFADALVAHSGYVKTFMSEPLDAALRTLNPIISMPRVYGEDEKQEISLSLGIPHREEAEFHRIERYTDVVDRLGYTAAKEILEVRRLLQAMGTEVGRNMFGESVWVDIAREKILESRAAGTPVVITGIRYQNEIDLVRELGGYTVWVERTVWPVKEPHPLTDAIDAALQSPEEPQGVAQDTTAAHSSETSLHAEDFDIFIENDSTLQDLEAQAVRLAEEIRNGVWDRF